MHWKRKRSSLDHATFRQLSYTQGRWTSPDPYDGSYAWANPQTFNRYAYVLNNPMIYLDPSGLDDCQATEGGYTGDCQYNGDGSTDDPSQDPGSNYPGDPGYDNQVYAGDPSQNPSAVIPLEYTIKMNVWQFVACALYQCGYIPVASFSGPGWQLFGAVPMGMVYGPQMLGGGGGAGGGTPSKPTQQPGPKIPMANDCAAYGEQAAAPYKVDAPSLGDAVGGVFLGIVAAAVTKNPTALVLGPLTVLRKQIGNAIIQPIVQGGATAACMGTIVAQP